MKRFILAALLLCPSIVFPQGAALSPVPKIQFLDNNGKPLANGYLYTYSAGTTTPLPTYTDASGTTQNTDPVRLDSGGFANIWLSNDSYRMVLQDSKGATIWTVDNVQNTGQIQIACAGTPNCFVKLDANGFVPQSNLNYVQGTLNSTGRTMQDRLRDFVSVTDFGAKGDGTTDDTPAINNAVSNICAAGGGTVYFPATYLASDGNPGQQANYKITSHISLGPNCNNLTISGYGARMTLAGNDCFFLKADDAYNGSHYTVLTGDVAAGDKSLTVQDTSIFTVGQDIYYRFNSFSSPEVRDFGFARVIAIPNSTHLTIDQPLPFTVSVAGQTTFGKLVLSIQNYELDNLRIHGLRLTLASGSISQGAIYLRYARNADIRDITCDNAMTGCTILQFSESSAVSNIFVTSSRQTGGSVSTGRVMDFAECKNINISNVTGYDFDGEFAYFEATSKNIYVKGLYIHDTAQTPLSSLCFICVEDRSQVYFDGIYIDGDGGSKTLFSNNDVFDSSIDHLQIYSKFTDIGPGFVPLIRSLVVRSGVGASLNGNTFDQTQTVTRILYPDANTNAAEIGLPAGLLKTLTVYTTSTTGLLHLYDGVGTTGYNDLVPSLTALQSVNVTGPAKLGIGASYPVNTALTNHTMIVYTDGTWVPGNRIIVRATYMPPATLVTGTFPIDDQSKSLLEDTVMYVGTITTTAANSDALSVPNLTPFTRCTWVATNTTATGMVTAGPVYISQNTTQVFLNHPMTAGGTFNISCQGFF